MVLLAARLLQLNEVRKRKLNLAEVVRLPFLAETGKISIFLPLLHASFLILDLHLYLIVIQTVGNVWLDCAMLLLVEDGTLGLAWLGLHVLLGSERGRLSLRLLDRSFTV